MAKAYRRSDHPENRRPSTNLNPGFVESVAPTPIIIAAEPRRSVGSAAIAPQMDFAPRIGFAWRVGNNNKTVLRGGYGRFIETLLSGYSHQRLVGGRQRRRHLSRIRLAATEFPSYSGALLFPIQHRATGLQFFDLAAEMQYKDPIVEEWNLTLERDLGKGVGCAFPMTAIMPTTSRRDINAEPAACEHVGIQRPGNAGRDSLPIAVVYRHYRQHSASPITTREPFRLRSAAPTSNSRRVTPTRAICRTSTERPCARFRLCERAREHFMRIPTIPVSTTAMCPMLAVIAFLARFLYEPAGRKGPELVE